MNAMLIGSSSRKGVGKNSGTEYQINTLILAIPLSEADREKKFEHNTLKQSGYRIWKPDVSNTVYNQVEDENLYEPAYVDVEVATTTNQNDQLIQEVVKITFPV